MTPYLKSGAIILLTPNPGWYWVGWDGRLTVSSHIKPLILSSENIIVEGDVPLFTLISPRQYASPGFSDVPGLITTAFFSVDNDTLSDKIKVNDFFPLLLTSTGEFNCNYTIPSQKITFGGPIPDVIPFKSGTWKVLETKQDVFIKNNGCVDSRVPELPLHEKIDTALSQTNITDAAWHEMGGKATVIVALGLFVVAQTNPVGWVADVLAVAALAGAFVSGMEIGGGVAHLADFSVKVVQASNCADLTEAGKSFETGVAKLTVGGMGAILAVAGSGKLGATEEIIPANSGPKPSPNFITPTNPPQLPPETIPSGYNLRVMPKTAQYPDGYWVLEKPMPQGGFQKVDPSTMKPAPNHQTHVPLPPK